MARPTTKSFSKFIVEIETVPGSGVYVAPCGFKSKALQMTAATSTTTVPDCADPEAAAWTDAGVSALSGKITGGGIMAAENAPMWDQWFDSGEPLNIRVRIPTLGYRAGAALLSDLSDSVALGTEGNLVQRSVTLENAGAWPWTAGDPA